MTRNELEHIIRASADITDQYEHCYVTLAHVLELVQTMPVGANEQRRLRATVQRWAKAVFKA